MSADELETMMADLAERLKLRLAQMTPEERAAEDAETIAWEARVARAADPAADDHLKLVRVEMGRWSVIQYWFLNSARDARAAIRNNAQATTKNAEISAALRTAKIRTVEFSRYASRQLVSWASTGSDTTLGGLARSPDYISNRRGEPRLIGVEYTGRRRANFERVRSR